LDLRFGTDGSIDPFHFQLKEIAGFDPFRTSGKQFLTLPVNRNDFERKREKVVQQPAMAGDRLLQTDCSILRRNPGHQVMVYERPEHLTDRFDLRRDDCGSSEGFRASGSSVRFRKGNVRLLEPDTLTGKNVQPELPADRSPVRKKSDVQTSNASTNREQILPSGIVSG
jgi:hypothetical protein